MSKISVPFVRSAYNYDRNAASDESGISCPLEEKMTKDSFREETDINTIVRRFGLTGALPTDVRMPTYADFTSVFDFQSAMNAIREAQESFYEMPAEVRARFDNDPHRFVEFCSDEKNLDEAGKLGLVKPEVLEARRRAAEDAEDARAALRAAKRVASPVAALESPPKGGGSEGGKTS